MPRRDFIARVAERTLVARLEDLSSRPDTRMVVLSRFRGYHAINPIWNTLSPSPSEFGTATNATPVSTPYAAHNAVHTAPLRIKGRGKLALFFSLMTLCAFTSGDAYEITVTIDP